MGDIVSFCTLSVDGPQIGSKILTKVQDWSETSDRSKEIVKAVGVKQGAGKRRKSGGGTISMNVYEEKGTPEVDWRRAEAEDWEFAMSADNEGGTKVQWLGVEVSNVAADKDAEGNNMLKVELIWEKRKPIKKN